MTARTKSSRVGCQADGAFTATKPCLPVACAAVPKQEHVPVNHQGTELTFPLSVASTCASGYALHEDKHKDIDYDISCEADAKLAYYSHGKRTNRGCRAIDCGTWPLIKNAHVSGGTRFGETISVECTNGRSTTRSYLKMHAK